MTRLSDVELWEYIREDLPYFDLTTHLLDVASQEAVLSIMTREPVVVACSEEAARIAELLGCEVRMAVPSGEHVQAQGVLLEITGKHEELHQAWRLCQILLEYACGMATEANAMLQEVRGVNLDCEILLTRKSPPFAKRFVIRALLCGGVMPHRLGLSETVLVFDQHRALFKDQAGFQEAMLRLRHRCVEKSIAVESESLDDAKMLLSLGADVIQMDKCSYTTLKELVIYKNSHFPSASILAAGGIHRMNVAEFARTGVDGVVTSSLYSAGMADLSARWERV